MTTLTSCIDFPQDSVSTVCGQGQHISQCWFGDQTTTVLVLCVSQRWIVMYGDHSGVTGGAELLYVISLHTAELHSGKLEAVFRGWV